MIARTASTVTTRDKPADRADDPNIAEKMAAEAEGIFLWAFEGLRRLVRNDFKFTESDRARRNRELVKRDSNNFFDFMEAEDYIRLKADACISSKVSASRNGVLAKPSLTVRELFHVVGVYF